jgi:hypothetical protein
MPFSSSSPSFLSKKEISEGNDWDFSDDSWQRNHGSTNKHCSGVGGVDFD